VDVVNRVNAQVGGNYVKNISVSLTNVKEFEIADADVVQFAPQRTGPCKTAINLDRNQGEQLTMIKSVLQADATYNVTYTDQASAAIQAQIVPTIAVNLNAAVGGSSASAFSGTELYWGVRDNSALVDWPTPPVNPPAPRASPNAHFLARKGLSLLSIDSPQAQQELGELFSSGATTEPSAAPNHPLLQPGAVVSQVQDHQ
jgi:hypothetical protein